MEDGDEVTENFARQILELRGKPEIPLLWSGAGLLGTVLGGRGILDPPLSPIPIPARMPAIPSAVGKIYLEKLNLVEPEFFGYSKGKPGSKPEMPTLRTGRWRCDSGGSSVSGWVFLPDCSTSSRRTQ